MQRKVKIFLFQFFQVMFRWPPQIGYKLDIFIIWSRYDVNYNRPLFLLQLTSYVQLMSPDRILTEYVCS